MRCCDRPWLLSNFRSLCPPSLAAERRGDIAVLRLARPEKRNALDDETVLGSRASSATLPDDVKAVVLHGEGDHFSAGLDLCELDRARRRPTASRIRACWHRAFEQIEFGRVPVVSVLHGAVVGGGLELAAAAHVRVAERSAYYGLPEGSRGIFVGGGGSVRLPRLIGVVAHDGHDAHRPHLRRRGRPGASASRTIWSGRARAWTRASSSPSASPAMRR